MTPTPRPGDGVSQKGGALGGDMTFGHVAVVEKVEETAGGWTVTISEGNFNDGGAGAWTGFNVRTLTEAQFRGAGGVFFRRDGW